MPGRPRPSSALAVADHLLADAQNGAHSLALSKDAPKMGRAKTNAVAVLKGNGVSERTSAKLSPLFQVTYTSSIANPCPTTAKRNLIQVGDGWHFQNYRVPGLSVAEATHIPSMRTDW